MITINKIKYLRKNQNKNQKKVLNQIQTPGQNLIQIVIVIKAVQEVILNLKVQKVEIKVVKVNQILNLNQIQKVLLKEMRKKKRKKKMKKINQKKREKKLKKKRKNLKMIIIK